MPYNIPQSVFRRFPGDMQARVAQSYGSGPARQGEMGYSGSLWSPNDPRIIEQLKRRRAALQTAAGELRQFAAQQSQAQAPTAADSIVAARPPAPSPTAPNKINMSLADAIAGGRRLHTASSAPIAGYLAAKRAGKVPDGIGPGEYAAAMNLPGNMPTRDKLARMKAMMNPNRSNPYELADRRLAEQTAASEAAMGGLAARRGQREAEAGGIVLEKRAGNAERQAARNAAKMAGYPMAPRPSGMSERDRKKRAGGPSRSGRVTARDPAAVLRRRRAMMEREEPMRPYYIRGDGR